MVLIFMKLDVRQFSYFPIMIIKLMGSLMESISSRSLLLPILPINPFYSIMPKLAK